MSSDKQKRKEEEEVREMRQNRKAKDDKHRENSWLWDEECWFWEPAAASNHPELQSTNNMNELRSRSSPQVIAQPCQHLDFDIVRS